MRPQPSSRSPSLRPVTPELSAAAVLPLQARLAARDEQALAEPIGILHPRLAGIAEGSPSAPDRACSSRAARRACRERTAAADSSGVTGRRDGLLELGCGRIILPARKSGRSY